MKRHAPAYTNYANHNVDMRTILSGILLFSSESFDGSEHHLIFSGSVAHDLTCMYNPC